MRVAVVCPYSLDLPGGVQGQVLGMAVGCARDHEVTVFTPGTSVPTLLCATGIKTVLVGSSVAVRANGSVAPISLSLRACVRLWRAVGQFDPEVCIIHEPMVPVVSLIALIRARGVRIGTFHRAGVTRGYRMLRVAAAHLLSRLDAGVVVSEEARDTVRILVGRHADGYPRIPNAVDLERFAPLEGYVRSKKTILFLGRHEPRKGLSVLLEAFVNLPSEYSLFIGGTGPQTAELRHRFPESDQIHWLGPLDDEQVVSCLHQTEIFVAPSLGGESFGVVLLEAMAAGAPVLSSDLPGYRLAAAQAARYVSPDDPAALAAAMIRLCEDDEALEELRRLGRKRAGEFTFGEQVDRYIDLADRVRYRREHGRSADS